MRLRVLHFREELLATVGAAKHGNYALNMCNVFWKIVNKEDEVAEEGQRRRGVELRLQFVIALQLHHLHLQEDRGVVHGQVKGGSEKLEVRNQRLDVCKMGGKFVPQRGDDTNASVQIHVVRGTSSKARKMHKLTSSQLSLPQAQVNLEGRDVRVHVCHENFFTLQLHVEGIQVCSDIREQGQASEPSRVGEVISVGKVLLTEEGGDLLLQVAHTGQHGSMTQPVDLTEVEQVVVVHIHLVHRSSANKGQAR